MTSSPNLKKVHSKVGSLANAKHKPGGGEFKIKSQKLEWRAEPRTKALNEGYTPQGGDKRVNLKYSLDVTKYRNILSCSHSASSRKIPRVN